MTSNARPLIASLVVLGALLVWASFWTAAGAPLRNPSAPSVSVVFMGDIMLDRNVALAARTSGVQSIFASTSELFAAADLRVGNLEGTITTNPSIAQRDNNILRFTFDPSIAQAVLEGLNLSAVSLANNHSLDFGDAGYDSTRHYVAQWGVGVFGHPLNTAGLLVTTLQDKGKKICLVGYMELFAPDTTPVVEQIKTIRPDCWRVVVFAHWGVEYSHDVSASQSREAHEFIDAGADLVVGAHPHVVEGSEVYKGHAIFYSLGNFIFDQDFSWGTQHGVVLRADFYADHTLFTLMPTTVVGGHVSPSVGAERDRTLSLAGLPPGADTLNLPL